MSKPENPICLCQGSTRYGHTFVLNPTLLNIFKCLHHVRSEPGAQHGSWLDCLPSDKRLQLLEMSMSSCTYRRVQSELGNHGNKLEYNLRVSAWLLCLRSKRRNGGCLEKACLPFYDQTDFYLKKISLGQSLSSVNSTKITWLPYVSIRYKKDTPTW